MCTECCLVTEWTKITSGSYDSTIKIWDIETYECLKTLKTLNGHTNYVRSVAWSPDGQKIASGLYDNRIKIWDAENFCKYPYFNKFQFID